MIRCFLGDRRRDVKLEIKVAELPDYASHTGNYITKRIIRGAHTKQESETTYIRLPCK